MGMIDKNGLKIDSELHDFIVNEAIPGTGVDADAFFKSFAAIVADLAPTNRALRFRPSSTTGIARTARLPTWRLMKPISARLAISCLKVLNFRSRPTMSIRLALPPTKYARRRN